MGVRVWLCHRGELTAWRRDSIPGYREKPVLMPSGKNFWLRSWEGIWEERSVCRALKGTRKPVASILSQAGHYGILTAGEMGSNF